MRILAIAGSLRAGSFNKLLLREAVGLATGATELAEWDGLREVPPFSEDDEDLPGQQVHALRGEIDAADAVLVVTPEYNGSIPGQLKNALDWASRPFPDNVLRDKPVAVIGASPSPAGAARSQAEAREVLRRIGAHVLDHELSLCTAHEQFDGDGHLLESERRSALERLLEALATVSVQRYSAA